MDNKTLADMIREKHYEQKRTGEYKLKLNKVIEMKDNFLKDFSKEQVRGISIFGYRKRSTPFTRS